MNKPRASIAALIAFALVLSGASVALAQEGRQGQGLQQQGQLPPPPQGGRGQNDGPGNGPRGPRPQDDRGMGSTTPGLRLGQRDDRDDRGDNASSTPQKRPVSEQQLQRMLKQAMQLSNLLSRGEKQLQSAESRLEKQGFALSSECKQAVTDADTLAAELKAAKDTSSVRDLFDNAADSQDALRTCQREAAQLSQAGTIFKTLQKMIDKLKTAKVDVTQLQDTFNSDVQPSFAALKSSDPSDDDIAAFFDAVSNFRDDLLNAFDDANIAEPRDLKGANDLSPARGMGPQSLNVQNGLANLGAAIISIFGL